MARFPTRKDRRHPLTGDKSVDSSCGNNGDCPWCQGNRLHKHRKRMEASMVQLEWFDGSLLDPFRVHKLKTWPVHFRDVKEGIKDFEVRKDDRDYQIGDYLWLYEYDPELQEYSGSSYGCRIKYMLKGGQFGIQEGYVVLGLCRSATANY